MAAYDTEQEGDLFRAVFYNITDLLEETLSSGVRVNASDSHGRTPLHEAASCAHLACLDILLKYGADVDRKSFTGQTALHRAATSRSTSDTADIMGCVRRLVESGASLDIRDGAGMTPLQVADQVNNFDAAAYLKKALDERRENEEIRKRHEHLQRMHKACDFGDQVMLDELLSVTPDMVNSCLDDGCTLLHRSCQRQDVDMVRFLVSRGAELIPNHDKKTPLDCAAEAGASCLVAELMHCRSKSVDGNFALLVAAEKGHTEVVETLIVSQVVAYKELADQVGHGLEEDEDPVDLIKAVRVNINCVDEVGRTALHRAAQSNFVNVLRVLLTCAPRNIHRKHGIDTGSLLMSSDSHSSVGKGTGHSGSYNMMTSEAEGSVASKASVLSLFKKNIILDLELCSHNGHTPFFEACQRRNFDVIRLLARSGANVNAMVHPQQLDKAQEYNALVDAVVKDHVGLAAQLLACGAEDTPNCMAFQTAVQFGKDHMVAVMLAHNGVVEIVDTGAKEMKRKSQHVVPEKKVLKFSAHWNDVTLHLKGDWDLKYAWLALVPQYLPSTGTAAVIVKLHLRKNRLTKVPLEVFQMESLELLDLANNALKSLPSASSPAEQQGTLFDDESSSVDALGWNCQKLKEINVSMNELVTLPRELFLLKSLRQVYAQRNKISLLPVEMWMSEAVEEMNISYNCLEDLPRLEPCLFPQCSGSPAMNERRPRSRTKSQRKRPRAQTVGQLPDESLHSLRAFAASLRTTVSSRHGHEQSFGDEGDGDDPPYAASTAGSLAQKTHKSSLRILYMSHNELTSVPLGLPCLAQKLDRLDLSQNHIESLGCPSDYPMSLTTLDVSGNGAVQSISPVQSDISSNAPVCYGLIQDSLPGRSPVSIPVNSQCRHRRHENLPKLTLLKAAENKLTKFFVFSGKQSHHQEAGEEAWVDIKPPGQESDSHEEAAEKPLFPNLQMLDVRCNQLTAVPHRVWDLPLQELLLSCNKDIKELPTALGRLVNLFRFDLEGVSGELLQSIPTHIDPKKATEIIRHLRSMHERSQEYRRMKLMLVGRQRQGKSTLLRALKQGCEGYIGPHFNARRKGLHSADSGDPKSEQMSTVGVDLGVWKCTGEIGRFKFLKRHTPPAIEFRTWDFAGQDEYYATHQCFLSKRALYLVVWNVEDDDEGIEEMEKWLKNIQTRAPEAAVILIGTHIDKVTDAFLQRIGVRVKDRYLVGSDYMYQKEKGLPRILDVAFVSCTGGKGIDNLRQLIYTTASNLTVLIGSYQVKLMEQRVPYSYIKLETEVSGLAVHARDSRATPVLSDTEFRDKAGVIISDPDDLNQAVKFLHDNGSLLHYDDPQLRQFYFLDPQWLCDMLAHIVTVDQVNNYIKDGIMRRDQLVHVFRRGAFQLKEDYIHLMTKFEVALPVGAEGEYLLVPSKLPDSIHKAQSLEPPRYDADVGKEVEVLTATKSIVCRFYYMMYVPSGFWPRLISRILSSRRFNQILSSVVVVSPDNEEVSLESVPSANSAPSWFYWKTGIELRANCGPILSIKEVSASQEGVIGTMVTTTHGSLSLCLYGALDILDARNYRCVEVVASNLSENRMPSDSMQSDGVVSLKTAELLTTAVEAIDVLLEDWYPAIGCSGSTGLGNPFLSRIVPCPDCLECLAVAEREASPVKQVTKEEIEINSESEGFHSKPSDESSAYYSDIAFMFQLQECALKAQHERVMNCPRHGEIELARMTPDLLFRDLKLNLIVDPRQLFEDEIIGQGAFADVCKGLYYPRALECDASPDTGIAVAIKKLEQRQRDTQLKQARDIQRQFSVDELDTQSYKAYKAYLETRREVAVLANIDHSHIVQFFGVRLDPRSLILEWAPKGSLEEILKTYEDSSIAPRPLQQLIIQVADGVHYLHCHDIVYRDLKSSNVLVWKFPVPPTQAGGGLLMETDERHGVWVKLADFGISRLAEPGGLVRGECGTPGFMAPEIVLFRGDEAYTKKADIYSFAMLMYEILCHQYPYAGFQQMEIENKVRKGILPELPKKVIQYPQCAVRLMQHCWSHNSKDRPTAERVLKVAESEQFVRLLDSVELPASMQITACCLVSAELLAKARKYDDNSFSASSSSDQEEPGSSSEEMTRVMDSSVSRKTGLRHSSTSSVDLEEFEMAFDAIRGESVNDELWVCEQQVATSNNTRLDIAEYFRERDSSFKEFHDTNVRDVVCSMVIVGTHVVIATLNIPRLLVYDIESRSKQKPVPLPLRLTDDCGLRQMIYAGDSLFLALQCGNVVSWSAKDIISPGLDFDLLSEARVCTGLADDLFCIASVAAKEDKPISELQTSDLELWCGLGSRIAIVDARSMMQLTEIDIELDVTSVSAFVVNTVAFLAVSRSIGGQQTVWASVQPGTFVYGFLAATREQVASINCLPHLSDLSLIPTSNTFVRQLSSSQGTITALEAMGSQLYIGTSSGHILVLNEARTIQVLHAHSAGVGLLLPFEVESVDPQWLPRFWRSQPFEVAEMSESLNLSTSLPRGVMQRKLLISFGHGCKHDTIEQFESQVSPTHESRHRTMNNPHMMIWLVDDNC